MSSKEFWDLTLYDVGGWVGRIQKLQQTRKEQMELTMEMTRTFMAFYANFKIDTKKHAPLQPTDIFRLSYDPPETERVKEDYDDLMDKMKKAPKRKKTK